MCKHSETFFYYLTYTYYYFCYFSVYVYLDYKLECIDIRNIIASYLITTSFVKIVYISN